MKKKYLFGGLIIIFLVWLVGIIYELSGDRYIHYFTDYSIVVFLAAFILAFPLVFLSFSRKSVAGRSVISGLIVGFAEVLMFWFVAPKVTGGRFICYDFASGGSCSLFSALLNNSIMGLFVIVIPAVLVGLAYGSLVNFLANKIDKK